MSSSVPEEAITEDVVNRILVLYHMGKPSEAFRLFVGSDKDPLLFTWLDHVDRWNDWNNFLGRYGLDQYTNVK